MKSDQKNMPFSKYRGMNCKDYALWSELTIVDYADDLIKNHLYCRNKALHDALKSFNENLPQGIRTQNNYFRVYENEGEVAGYLWFNIIDDSAFLLDLMVLPEYHGKGIGKVFLKALINELINMSISEVELRVSPENHRALSLYKDLGFRTTGFDMSLLLHAKSSDNVSI